MALTFADTHNMIAYLTKSDASEGFNQIINFLNASSIRYALTVNPNIYVSCIKQFWTSVSVKKVNYVTRLQALVDKKRVIITEATIRDALRLDDAEGMVVAPQVGEGAAKVNVDYVHAAGVANKGAASATITAAALQLTTAAAPTLTTAPSSARRRKGVEIRDPEETATPSIIIHTELKSKDKGKGIMVHEPKPLKNKTQIEQDEAYARELEAELDKNIDWDEVIEKFQRKEKEGNDVKRYQALKRKPQTKA
nr:xylulose kinase-1 [Tanacetum cinerariifolium]